MKFVSKSLLAICILILTATSAFAGLRSVINCSSNVKSDMNTVANYIDANWNSYERFVERETGLNIKSCLKNRFQKNGKAECRSSGGQCSGNVMAWATYLGKKANFCPLSINSFEALDRTPNQRACYAALLAHEFSHTCWGNESRSELVEAATFNFWADTHNVTIIKRDCRLD